jgi:hypothetical protein
MTEKWANIKWRQNFIDKETIIIYTVDTKDKHKTSNKYDTTTDLKIQVQIH